MTAQPTAPPRPAGPGLRDYIGRLGVFDSIRVSPREQAALQTAGVTDPPVQRLLVWRRTVLVVILPLLVVACVLALVDVVQLMSGDSLEAEYQTGFGTVIAWLPPVTLLALPLGAVIAVARWTDTHRSSRLLISSWVVATVTPLVTALFPLEWSWDFDTMGEDDARLQNRTLLEWLGHSPQDAEAILDDPAVQTELQQDIATMTTGNAIAAGMFSAVTFTVVLLPVIVGLVNGVLRGARRTKTTFPSAIVPGWFVVIAAPFYSIVLCTMFAIISPLLGDGSLTVGILLLALAPLANLLFMRKFTRPMPRAEAGPVFFRSTLISFALSFVGVALVLLYLFTGEVHDTSVLGSSDDVNDGLALFSYVSISQAGVGMVARFQFTMLVMTFLFTRLVYREGYELATMSDTTRREHVEDMRGLQHFATGVPVRPTPATPSRPAGYDWLSPRQSPNRHP